MNEILPSQSIVITTISYIVIAILFFVVVFILFVYFTRKKILQTEIDNKNKEIQHQKELLYSNIQTQEEERARIAQDLHDDISSKLNVVNLNSHLLEKPNLSQTEAKEIIENIKNLTFNALENSRRIAHHLSPPVLEKFGLQAGLEELVAEYNSTKKIKVTFNQNAKFDIFTITKQTHIFRIYQELLNNSVKHGKAENAILNLIDFPDKIECSYTDDGVGFNLENLTFKGLGMSNIKTRIEYLNSDLVIKSSKNNGFYLKFELLK
jgi:two-component system NarL family sensor kinase